MKKPFVLHPFLFAIFPILFLFAHNRAELLSYSEISVPLIISLVTTVLMFLLATVVLKDSKKAGIIVSVLLILFFSYGHIRTTASEWKIGGFSFGGHAYQLILWALLFTLAAFFIIRRGKAFDNLTKILNVIAVSLVAISLFNIGSYEMLVSRTQANVKKDGEEKPAITKESGKTDVKRDVYFIVLDGYASSDTLKKTYGYDNSEFTDYLKNKGFTIASKSRSNYTLTYLSIASTLNMGYIQDLADIKGATSNDREISYKLVRDNKVISFFKANGYKTIHFNSGWRETEQNENADLNFNCSRGSDFQTLMIKTTMLSCFENNLVKGDSRKRVLGTFSKLGKVPEIEGPKFVFAHILVPHPPYLFDEKGDPVSGTEMEMCGRVWLQKPYYINQMKYVNQQVEKMVDEILSKSKVPPIIILQADHGSASMISQNNSSGWKDPSDEMLVERMRILNACYLPSNDGSLLYDSATTVNTFRLIFNYYFGADYELLDDQSFFSSYDHPYKLKNITDIVKTD